VGHGDDNGSVAQVSLPMRIVLLVAVLFSVAWFSFLRPGSVTSGAATSAQEAVQAPISAIDKAKAAAAATDRASSASDAASDAAGGGTSSTPSSPSGTKGGAGTPATGATKAGEAAKAAASGDVGARISSEVQAGKVVVVLFWDRRGADDRAARDAVRSLPDHGGKVATHVVPISQVGSLEGLTRGVSVTQSPTTIIINRKATARTLVGLTDPTQVDQLVRAALADR
jgi:hypothetical protein